MKYKAILQCCVRGKWFEPGDEVTGISQSSIHALIKSGAVRSTQLPPPREILESKKGGDD